jgi:hypothetical protein
MGTLLPAPMADARNTSQWTSMMLRRHRRSFRIESNGQLSSVGVQCAFCHSTVDDSFAPGIGHRLDGLGESRSECRVDRSLRISAPDRFGDRLDPRAHLIVASTAVRKNGRQALIQRRPDSR